MNLFVDLLIAAFALSNVIWLLNCIDITKSKKRFERLSNQALDCARKSLSHSRSLFQKWNKVTEETWKIRNSVAVVRQFGSGICVVVNGFIIRKFELGALTQAKDLCRALNRMDGVISNSDFIDPDEPWRLELCKDCMYLKTDFCACHDKRGRSPQANACHQFQKLIPN